MERTTILVIVATLVLTSGIIQTVCATAPIVFLPLDERFTTRDAFLNLAKVTPYEILTPPTTLLPHIKVPPPLQQLVDWVSENVVVSDSLIASSEMYLYGGLIQSRSSNDTTEQILDRLSLLINYKVKDYNLKFYLSAVVMRIPAYNSDFEEPWYWAYYGYDLYSYSYYYDEYLVTGNKSCLEIAQQYESKVPSQIVKEFVWRRERNYNVTMHMLELQLNWKKQGLVLFDRLYITLDDNALYGFNIAEAENIRAFVQRNDLSDRVYIYPGADEVGLTMLSRYSVDSNTPFTSSRNNFKLFFRDPSTIDYIPNYEGQPMIQTLKEQLYAAGGDIVNETEKAQIILIVNNFSNKHQTEAPNQSLNRSISDYAMFTPIIQQAMRGKYVVGFADNRFSNGADIFFVRYINDQHTKGPTYIPMQRFAYAGWNTDGNTLGTVISNSILLSLFNKTQENAMFNSLRFLEDDYYQATSRQFLEEYVDQVNGMSTSNLAGQGDLKFYEDWIYKLMNSKYMDINSRYSLPYILDKAYYPWNRTFEIGFIVKQK